MADDTKKDAVQTEQTETPEQESPTSEKPSWLKGLAKYKWVALFLGVSIANFGIGFACCRMLTKTPPVATSPEVTLGEFCYESDDGEIGSLSDAKFSLHVALLDHVDQLARQELESHKFRLRQDIEELLRRAHSGDFDDPKLGGLKRQLQEQLNQTLGMRVIADVIITDLQLSRADTGADSQPNVADDPSWTGSPSRLTAAGDRPAGH